MTVAHGFDAVSDAHALVLILGSMPGRASLTAGRYYAHPRNAFWPIMGELIGAGPALSYARRCEQLRISRIALWDVLQRCQRQGSLDASIDNESLEINDFNAFFDVHPYIRHVFFNGRKAEECFRRRVLPTLDHRELTLQRLPSTSPAHAAMSHERKLEAWRRVLDVLPGRA